MAGGFLRRRRGGLFTWVALIGPPLHLDQLVSALLLRDT